MPVSKKNQKLPKLWQSIKPQQSVRQFENTIIQFHSSHRASIRQLPYVLGKKINLRKLYISVIKRGGYKKVNESNEWEDVLDDLNLPKETTNCELAIQSIYHRYLEEYEREQWNALSSGSYGDSFSTTSNDNNSVDIDISKHSSYISELAVRDKSFLAAFVNDNTPKVFCDYQHIVNSSIRSEAGLSCDMKELNELNHLKMSLMSGLSNEIEFALNTLLIMSNSNQMPLDLRFTGNLLDLILVTVGIFEPASGSYYTQFKNCSWMKDCLKFWNNTVEDGVGRIFLIPNIFSITKSKIKNLWQSGTLSCNPNRNCLFNNECHYDQISDPCAQRIHLVATVLYNLINDSILNSRTLIHNFQFLRFLFLSVHSTDPILRRLCLQTISKLRFVLYPITPNSMSLPKIFKEKEQSMCLKTPSEEVDEEDSDSEWFSQFLLDFVQSLLSSENRCDRIAALELIQTLCLIEENQQTLNNSLQTSFIATISSQLLIPDIHPLCCALESLVSLSQLGEDMCRRMAMCQSLLKVLLQFIQIEAQMFGPSAVYKIKTFNQRPPVPMPAYHPLNQIMRIPSNNSVRQPFLNQPPSNTTVAMSNFVDPNIKMQCPGNVPFPGSVANYNSISTNSLSKMPLHNLIKPSVIIHQQFNNINNSVISNQLSNNQMYRSSHLTPLQQIDQLLTKSIASFENPPVKKETNLEEKPKNDVVFVKEIEHAKQTNFENKDNDDIKVNNNKEKRVVKIRCGIDGPDCEIGELNGINNNNKCDKELNGLSFEEGLSTIPSPKVSTNDSTNKSSKSSLNGEVESSKVGCNNTKMDFVTSSSSSCKQSQVYMNGNLEIDASNFDDPDRRQMPPPSLPTPSMLKKQMRPKLSPPSQVGVANGYLQQLNSKVKRKLVSEMTLTTNAQIEDRCERAKGWLRLQYKLSDDSKFFVLKQDLVDELQKFMFEDDNEDSHNQGSRRMFSAHELHNCIKDVFGNKVQVKVEQKQNGKSQLIYSNLCRIHDPVSEKSLPNGIVNSVVEMNGFFHNSSDKKRIKLNHKFQKKVVMNEENQEEKLHIKCVGSNFVNQKLSAKKHKKIRFSQHVKRINKAVSKAHHRLMLSRKNKLKGALKFKSSNCKMLLTDATKLNATSATGATTTTTCSPLMTDSHFISPKHGEFNNSNENQSLPIMCLWGSCTEKFSNENSLNFHLTNDHIPLFTPNSQSPRSHCHWQHCLTSSVPRAPLSLLSHVIQEHCYKASLSTFHPPNLPHRLTNPMSCNITSPTAINQIGISQSIMPNNFSQMSEKSGWSVLYDHFRLDEQMQPHLPEGPITKHIRISSSIILRNMSRHSIITKEFLKNHESLLSVVAMSTQDCAPIIIQCLDELTLPPINGS